MMIKKAQTEFIKVKNWNKYLFITGREAAGMRDMAISPMDSLLKCLAPQVLDWRVVAYSNEDHSFVPFKSVYDGLRFIFDMGVNFEAFPQSGIIPNLAKPESKGFE